eukprot:6662107-Pyramimonas_sp.AAC.1
MIDLVGYAWCHWLGSVWRRYDQRKHGHQTAAKGSRRRRCSKAPPGTPGKRQEASGKEEKGGNTAARRASAVSLGTAKKEYCQYSVCGFPIPRKGGHLTNGLLPRPSAQPR